MDYFQSTLCKCGVESDYVYPTSQVREYWCEQCFPYGKLNKANK